jgi:RAT1-interacting protein
MSRLPLSTRIKATVRQPREWTHFSIDAEDKTRLDDSSLKYYYFTDSELDQNIDLSQGFSQFVQKDESFSRHLDSMLLAVIAKERTTNKKVAADIITWRGIMTKLLTLPYSKQDDIDLNIVLFDDQIFIEEDFELSNQKKRPMNDKDKLMMYWGKFFPAVVF